MFGYFAPKNSTTSYKIARRYRDYYCTTCAALSHYYGITTRILLSYDVALLAMLLQLEVNICDPKRRLSRCLKFRKPMKDKESWNAIAALNILAFDGKLHDDINDENSIIAKTMLKLYNKPIKKAKYDYPGMAAAISEGYKNITDKEKNHASVLEIAHDFAKMMLTALQSEFSISPQTENVIIAVCSWIYLIDALDDYDKDIKKNRFNPIAIKGLTFNDYVNLHWREIYHYLDSTIGTYNNLGEKGFDYYAANIIINAFIPDVCENILNNVKIKKPLFSKKIIVFEDITTPYNGINIYVHLPANPSKLAILINDLFNIFKREIRLTFMYNNKRAIKRLINILDPLVQNEAKHLLSAAIESRQDTALEQLKQILFGYSNDCRHNSCIGRVFAINNNKIFACSKMLLPIENINSLSENEALIDILDNSIIRRENCKQTCDNFSLCQGGCPIENNCIELFESNLQAINALKGRLSEFNPAERSILINWVTHCRGRSELFEQYSSNT